jgi:hypothetical protein
MMNLSGSDEVMNGGVEFPVSFNSGTIWTGWIIVIISLASSPDCF